MKQSNGESAHGPGKPAAGKRAAAEPRTFRALIEAEESVLTPANGDGTKQNDQGLSDPGFPHCTDVGTTGEPWVVRTGKDRFGLALSGGGIRSATFNLGVLRALIHLGLLSKVHYLSTVSGGGYVGGFWTRWRRMNADRSSSGEGIFLGPTTVPGVPDLLDIRDPHDVRHLREFSGFLIPRLGASRSELWGALAILVAGLIPSLVASASVVLVLIGAWKAGQVELMELGAVGAAFGLAILTGIVLFGAEAMARKRKQFDELELALYFYTVNSVLGLAGVTLTAWGLLRGPFAVGPTVMLNQWDYTGLVFPIAWMTGFAAVRGSLHLFSLCDASTFQKGLRRLLEVFRFIRNLRIELLRMLKSQGFMQRFVSSCLKRLGLLADLDWDRLQEGLEEKVPRMIRIIPTVWAAAQERVLARLLALALPWAFIHGLWVLAAWLRTQSIQSGRTGSVGAVLTLVFLTVRGWLSQPDNSAGWTSKWLARLRPRVPQLLAHAVVILAVLTAMLWIQEMRERSISWNLLIGVPAALIVGAVVFFDPQKLGHHEFYRSRIARCFLGAAHPKGTPASDNRQSAERADDDMRLDQDVGTPIYLICCAANALGGDRMGTLHRGARSAVLSRHGLAMGNEFGPVDGLRLSSALTASAAAFNSCMGRYSVSFGSAVAFLMTALDLRLGLWVPHPWSDMSSNGFWRNPFSLPGFAHFREMFSLVSCDASETSRPPAGKHSHRNVHLSDGGHFENLGLYELVRRHCRHIIVSDCGADPARSFDDLGLAVRRVREDFGVEIELDLSSLRPDERGFAKQHVAVGTIHYDGVVGTDKGTLIYFKPGLTGDESVDVRQYGSANPLFPHEGTLDQFYDEAQWESYHKLGFHSALFGLRFLESKQVNLADAFREARHRTEALPWVSGSEYLQLTQRTTSVEESVRQCPLLAAEFFPEAIPSPVSQLSSSTQLDADSLFCLLRILQLMEEIWIGCELNVHWSHPLARGWMAYSRRWAFMPTLRRWWPFLNPLFGSQFVRFAERHLQLPNPSVNHPEATLRFHPVRHIRDLATDSIWSQWTGEHGPIPPAHDELFALELSVPGLPAFQVALAFVRRVGSAACWNPDNLFVPSALDGGGFHGGMLDGLIQHYEVEGRVCELHLEFAQARADKMQDWLRDPGERRARLELIDFYKSRKFTLAWDPEEVLIRPLNPPKSPIQ